MKYSDLPEERDWLSYTIAAGQDVFDIFEETLGREIAVRKTKEFFRRQLLFKYPEYEIAIGANPDALTEPLVSFLLCRNGEDERLDTTIALTFELLDRLPVGWLPSGGDEAALNPTPPSDPGFGGPQVAAAANNNVVFLNAWRRDHEEEFVVCFN